MLTAVGILRATCMISATSPHRAGGEISTGRVSKQTLYLRSDLQIVCQANSLHYVQPFCALKHRGWVPLHFFFIVRLQAVSSGRFVSREPNFLCQAGCYAVSGVGLG